MNLLIRLILLEAPPDFSLMLAMKSTDMLTKHLLTQNAVR